MISRSDSLISRFYYFLHMLTPVFTFSLKPVRRIITLWVAASPHLHHSGWKRLPIIKVETALQCCELKSEWGIFSQFTCPKITVFADLRRNKSFWLAESPYFLRESAKKSFWLAESPYFCVNQQKRKKQTTRKELVKRTFISGHVEPVNDVSVNKRIGPP